MIDPDFARTMARYDRWQNGSLMAAVDLLSDAERWQDRGAFFCSIAQTLNHILWDQHVWLARLRGDAAKAAELGARHPYTETPRDWGSYKEARMALDAEIRDWCDTLTVADLGRTVRWLRGGTAMETAFSFNLFHMFNHATHHRGQVHAMLTAAGIEPGSTDLPMMPQEV